MLAVFPHYWIGEDREKGCCGGAMPLSHDGWMHLNQMQSFWRGLSSGRIYPRWDEATHQGYGAPVTSFYPPGVYYLTSVLYAVLGDWVRVIKASNLALMILSGLAFYLYARRRLGIAASLAGMALYIFAPYHLINIYQRGALAELTGFIWMPLVLLFAERLGSDRGGPRLGRRWMLDVAGLAASFGAFLFSHPPTAYQMLIIFSPAMVVQGAAVSLRRRGDGLDPRGVALISLGLLYGVLLAAAYFFPAYLEKGLVNSSDVEKSWPYHASYVFDYKQHYYDRLKDVFFVRIDRIWLLNVVLMAASGAVFWVMGRGGRAKRGLRAWIWLAAGGLASFMMTAPSAAVGRLFPGIEIGVFSWRMLTITSLTTALVGGACLDLRGGSIGRRLAAAGIPALMLCAVVAFSCWYVVRPMYRAQAFYPLASHYNYATLPVRVPRDLPDIERVSLVSGSGAVGVEAWEPEYRMIVLNLETPARLRFRTSYFPGWTAVLDGREVATELGRLGEIQLSVPPGNHELKLEFRATPARFLSALISVVALALLPLMVVFALRRGQ